MEAMLFVIGMVLLAGLLGLLYWGYWNARKLDRQIQRGDPSLLTTSTYKREEVIQAPQGSVIMEGQIVQLPGQYICLLYTSPSPRDPKTSRMPSSA